jgi:hypothetical protein
MLHIDSRQMQGLQAARQDDHRNDEPQRLAAQLQRDYPELMARRGGAGDLLAELREALARCDALGLHGAEDRRIFCHWDQLLIPGLRKLPQWPQWLAHCRARQQPGEQSVLLRFLLETPPAWWQRQLQLHEAPRRARGLPGMDEALAAAARAGGRHA